MIFFSETRSWRCLRKTRQYLTINFAALVLSLTLILSSSGCANTTLTDGANLAKAGQTATAQMQQNVTLSSDTMAALRKAVAFNDGYNGLQDNQYSHSFLTNMDGIQTKLNYY